MYNINEEVLKTKINNWCDALTKKAADSFNDQIKHLAPVYAATYNKKYIRIWYSTGSNGKAAFAFVDYAGNIYKCAGWSCPAAGIRAHIDNPPMLMRELYR